MAKRGWLLSSVSIVSLLSGSCGLAFAADPYATPAGLPAVSAVNGNIGAFIGGLGDNFTAGTTGSFAVPLSARWGGQIDDMLGSAGGTGFYGIGGHLFTRDPAKGLLGAYASYAGWDSGLASGTNSGKLGVEGESYLGRISLEGIAAYQLGTYEGPAGKATVAFYPTDNLRLDLSYSHSARPFDTVTAGVEWSPTASNISLFADASAISGGDWAALVGLKNYFGASQKSLIRRDREDDPPDLLPDDLYSAIGMGCPPGTHEFNCFCDGNL